MGRSLCRRPLGSDLKVKISPVLDLTAVALAVVLPRASIALYAVVVVVWLVPDRRIEQVLPKN